MNWIVFMQFMFVYPMAFFSFSQLSNPSLPAELKTVFLQMALISGIDIALSGVWLVITLIWSYFGNLKYENDLSKMNIWELLLRIGRQKPIRLRIKFRDTDLIEIKSSEEMRKKVLLSQGFKLLEEQVKNNAKSVMIENSDLFSRITQEQAAERLKKIEDEEKSAQSLDGEANEKPVNIGSSKHNLQSAKVDFEQVSKLFSEGLEFLRMEFQKKDIQMYFLSLEEPMALNQDQSLALIDDSFDSSELEKVKKEEGITGILFLLPAEPNKCFQYGPQPLLDIQRQKVFKKMRITYPSFYYFGRLLPNFAIWAAYDCDLSQDEFWQMALKSSNIRSAKETALIYFAFEADKAAEKLKDEVRDLRQALKDLQMTHDKMIVTRLKDWVRYRQIDPFMTSHHTSTGSKAAYLAITVMVGILCFMAGRMLP